jgi:uncharacterized repeat protein (TIGR01451 family)
MTALITPRMTTNQHPPVKTVGDPNCTCDNESYCVTTDTLISISAYETGCCISDYVEIDYRIWYNEEWGEWLPYTEPFSFEEACVHQLEIRAMDCLGNTATDLETFYVDETAPELVKTVGDPHIYLGLDDYGHKVYYIYPLTEISFNAEELGCCPCFEPTIYYRYWYLGVWSDWMIYDEPITFHKGCVHYLEAYAVDCLGNAGEVDNETFWVCTSGEAGPTVTFINPSLGSTHCERTLDVMVKATDDITPSSELLVKIWIPGGRRNAPTFWYDGVYNASDGYFHALIDIYEYQNGAELTIEAWAVDEDGYANYALPTTFMVCSNVGYDQWHQKGWNSLTIPWGEIACSYDVENVLGSIDGNYAWVWYYDVVHDEWFSWYKYRDPLFNTLTMMEPGKQYWVWHETADRYFTDIYAPMVAITYPENGGIFNTTIASITGTAFDNESGIDYVTIRLYSNDTEKYWNGTNWDTTATDLLCNGTETWSYDTIAVPMTAGSYIVTATATDKVGCTAQDTHSFTIVSQACIASKTYTTDADFNEGTLIGINASNNQLQLISGEVTTYPVMWIANAGEDSISKWDTNTNTELARYHTWFGPLGDHGAWSGPAPSRTCVDTDGNCYVANRHFDGYPADVIKIYSDNWIDRNGNGVMDTCSDTNNNGKIDESEMYPITDTNGNGIIDPNEITDERVAWAVSIGPSGGIGRALAIDTDGNIWLGLYSAQQYYKLSSVNGSILYGPISVPITPYGALVDKYGILWGANLGYDLLRLDTHNYSIQTFYHGYLGSNYGIALGYDSLGNTHVYLGGSGYTYIEFNSSTSAFSTPAALYYNTNGIATDKYGNICAANTWNGGVSKFAPNGSLIWTAPSQYSGEYSTVVDSNNDVWAVHESTSKLSKFNGTTGAPLGVFDTGLYPYTYSDATGLGLRTSVVAGTWTAIFDSKAADTMFNSISWNSNITEGSSIVVTVRSSNDLASWSPLETATNGGALSTTPPGRYLQIEVAMKMKSGGTSPILYDLTIDGTCACSECQTPAVELTKQVWVPAQTGQQGDEDHYSDSTGGYITYTYTVADIVVFGYENNTNITIYDYNKNVIWTGTVDDGTYHLENVNDGVYKLVGDKKFSVLTGDPISDYVMGYYGMDQNGYGASTKLYTWMPQSYSSDYFIVFAYTDGTQVTITNKDTDTIVWSGTLNRGEHYTDETLSANFVEVESNYPVSALSYNDQGYFVPSANQKWSGTEFYTYADYLGYWPNTLHVMAYEDGTTVTIKNTDTAATVWSGTLNAGEEHEITTTENIYYSIFSDKTVTVGVLPVDGYQNGYYYGGYMMDKTGSGIGTEFYVPTLSGGMLWTFAFENDTTITVYDATTNTLVGTYHLNMSEAVDVNQGYGYWRIVSDKRISGYTGWGGMASAGFAPLLFGEAATGGYWADARTAIIGDSVRFKISVHNTGNTSLDSFNITDTLPIGLTYADGATVNGAQLEPTTIWNGGSCLTWSEPFILAPNEWGYIEFNATVTICGELINLADVSAWFMDTEVSGSDSATVSVACGEQLYSLCGTIYYTGNETGKLIIALFNQNPEDINVTPITTINAEEYAFPQYYIFDNLSPGTYYVAAHIDMNDNGGPPDPDEPQGWAINKSMPTVPPDPLTIINENFTYADITLAIPPEEEIHNPHINVEKYLWDEDDDQWETDSLAFFEEDTVSYNITVTNTGDVTLDDWQIQDWLQDGLSYKVGEVDMTVVQGSTVWNFTGPQAEPQEVQYNVEQGGWTYTVLKWWETGSEPFTFDPGTNIYIHFNATVMTSDDCVFLENTGNASAFYNDEEVIDDGTVGLYANCYT